MIHRLRIRNFKSIVDVTVDLEPVTVFVGRSGTGKTNFVEALRMLRNLLSADQVPGQLIQDWDQVRPATGQDGPLRFDITFSIVGLPLKFVYRLAVSQGGVARPQLNIDEETLQYGTETLFSQDSNGWASEPELVSVPSAGSIALGQISAISEITLAFTALTAGIGCYTFPDGVLTAERRRGMAFRQGESQTLFGLDDQGENYLKTMQGIVNSLQDLRLRRSMLAALIQINTAIATVELDNQQSPDHIVVGHRFNGKTLALRLSQESDGFRRFYAYLLALYQRPSKQTLVFEHPEDGIHPRALQLLADEIQAAPDDGRGQILVTTHSPGLLDHFKSEQLRVVEMKGFETQIGLVSTEQRAALQDRLLEPGELLTVDPARLEPTISEEPTST